MSPRRAGAPLAGALLLLCGCASSAAPGPRGLAEIHPWVRVAETPRAAFVERLGEPVVEFEGGRLAGWRLDGETGLPRPLRGERETVATTSLIVVFDARAVASRVEWVPHR